MESRSSTSVRGEHHTKKISDLSQFLTGVIYPALDKNLDIAFPEFGFKRGPNGFWVATQAPVNFKGYGYTKGKLIATGWGFRSLGTGQPAILWLSYANKLDYPRGPAFFDAVRKLGAKVRVTWDWECPREEIRAAELQERRDHFLEAFFAYAQGALNADCGKFARGYLSRNVGFPLHKLPELDLGYYPSVDEVRRGLNEAGYRSDDADNTGEVLGLFHPKWEGRLILPCWDLDGRRVVNVWGCFPGETPVGEMVYVCLNRPDPNQPFGSRDLPVGLHMAKKLKKRHLLLVQNPLDTLLIHSLGVDEPFPIASGDKMTFEQAETIKKYLQRSGDLTLNFDYDPNVDDIHAETSAALDFLGNSAFRLFAVDPIEMAGKGGYPKRVDPALFIRTKGLQSYRALVSKRTDAAHYRGHAQVTEYNPDNSNDEETPKDVIDAVETLVGVVEERQRAPELDQVFQSLVLNSESAAPVDDEEEAPAIAPEEGEEEIKESTYDIMIKHAQSILELEGQERATSYLLDELQKITGEESTTLAEAYTKTLDPKSDNRQIGFFRAPSATQSSGPEDVVRKSRALSQKLADNVKQGLVKVARDVAAEKIRPGDALRIVASCQEGVQILVKAIQDTDPD